MSRVNVWNDDDITCYLHKAARGHQLLGNYLEIALHRALLKHKDCLQPVTSLPVDAPDWMRRKWPADGPYVQFVPNDHLDSQVRYVSDWIAAALAREEAWLQDVDEQGRPRKLAVGSLEAALAKAAKAMVQQRNYVPEDNGDTRSVMEFPRGFRIVQLLSPAALDVEGCILGHCIGDGAYDDELCKGNAAFYSLRDGSNRPHATFNIDIETNVLKQCKGKENKPPAYKYMPFVKAFVERGNFGLNEAASHTGLIKAGTNYHSIFHLPENLEITTNLDLRDTSLTSLPAGLKIRGYLDLRRTAIKILPANLWVGKYLDLSNTSITELPEGLRVGLYLDLSNTLITELPERLCVGGGLNLSGTAINVLPENINVGGYLNVRDALITELPEKLCVGGKIIGLTEHPSWARRIGKQSVNSKFQKL